MTNLGRYSPGLAKPSDSEHKATQSWIFIMTISSLYFTTRYIKIMWQIFKVPCIMVEAGTLLWT